MQFSRSDFERAVTLSDFDGWQAQLGMKPINRTRLRPPERPGNGRVGAVLILLYPVQDRPHLVLTRRRDDLGHHAGQISLPGGRREGNESLAQTALRETEEEVGVPRTAVQILGELTSLYIPPSDFTVHPFVGWTPRQPRFRPEIAEVDQIIEVALEYLLQPSVQTVGAFTFSGKDYPVPYYDVDGHRVWGATAMILSEFLARLRHATAE